MAKGRIWLERVGLSFNEKLKNDDLRDLATRRLILMKEALSEVSIRMSGEELADVAKNDEDNWVGL